MDFDSAAYGEAIAAILKMGNDGRRAMPLVAVRSGNPAVRPLLWNASPPAVPATVKAGLLLYFGYFDDAHSVAQDEHSAEGSYWHGILHRMEPDAGNAGYWFRRVGKHAIFPALRDEAEAFGYVTGEKWDPFAFIDACDTAKPGSARAHLLEQVQLAEWQLLLDYCARLGK